MNRSVSTESVAVIVSMRMVVVMVGVARAVELVSDINSMSPLVWSVSRVVFRVVRCDEPAYASQSLVDIQRVSSSSPSS